MIRGGDGAAATAGAVLLNQTPGGLIGTRCDPYGAESQIKLMGGLYPESYLGRHMWHCDRLAAARFRMVCPHGHRGQVMPLCGPGIVRAPGGEAMFHPGHYYEISRRQGGVCTRCIWPPEALVARELDLAGQRDLADAMARHDPAGQAAAKRKMIEAGQTIDELMTRGVVHRCPLRLEAVA